MLLGSLIEASLTLAQEEAVLKLDGGAGDSPIAYICIYKAKKIATKW
jgi:hypothetical protein